MKQNSITIKLQAILYVSLYVDFTPTPNQNENAKTTARSNFDAEAFGDMFSTLYNRI